MSWAEDQGLDCYDDNAPFFRTGIWRTKTGKEIRINKMTDRHLFNAYELFRDKELFEEMVLRLFLDKVAGS